MHLGISTHGEDQVYVETLINISERKALENKLLERQIELLEKSQEYRCCPEVKAESDDED